MSITKKNHVNPCFWSALWNKDYFQKFISGLEHPTKAREQRLHFLEINSNKALEDKAENIHFEKSLGLAEITRESMLDFCKRNHPDKYESFAREMEDHPDTLFLDFENVFSKLEELPIYKTLINSVRKGSIDTLKEKYWLAMFLTHHVLRSHVYINSLTNAYKNEGMEKFEALIKLKWSLSDPNFMAFETYQLIERHWTVYKIERSILPLSDCPIVGSSEGVLFATLSPNTLLTVERKKAVNIGINYLNRIPPSTFKQYMRTTIHHTHKGLVFMEKKDLLKCQDSVWWKKRRLSIKN